MHSLKNTHNHKKEPCEILQKKIFKKKFKKIFRKKIQKKIEERLPRFSRSPIGGGQGAYTSAMVIACLYGYNRRGDRHKDREIQSRSRSRSRNAKIHLICLFVWIGWLVGLLWFGSVQIFASIKKFFNFPNFFSNCLIFNAFQI